MPLSEHEQRLLDQIERALYQEDPKFASTVRQTDLRTHMRRRLRRAALVLVLGFGMLLASLISLEDPARTALGVAGFVVMVGALLLAMTAWKRMQPGSPELHVVGESGSPQRPSGSRPQRSRPTKQRGAGGSRGGMKDRLEERWKRRWDERGGER